MPQAQVQVVHRLSPEAYASVAALFRPFTPTDSASVLQAGYALGVEAVLKALRDNIVITPNPRSN